MGINEVDLINTAFRRMEEEKRQRMYYQSILYNLCMVLDAAEGHSARAGNLLRVGNANDPSDEVVTAVKRLLDDKSKLAQMKRTRDGFLITPAMYVYSVIDGAVQRAVTRDDSWVDGFHDRVGPICRHINYVYGDANNALAERDTQAARRRP